MNTLLIYDADSLVWTSLEADNLRDVHALSETIALTSNPQLTEQRYRDAGIPLPTIIDRRRGRLVDDILDHSVGRPFVWIGLHLRRDDHAKLTASPACCGIYEMVPGRGLDRDTVSELVALLSV